MDSFLHNHQSALDSQREDDAIQYLQDAGVYLDPNTDIVVGDYVQTTEEYDSLCSISGEVIEDYGNKSDLQIIEPTDEEMMASFGTKWHDWL